MCSNPPPFQWQHFRRLYLLHSSGRQRYLCQASSLSSPSCDLTFVLTPEVDLCMPLTPRSLKSVHSFSKYRIHNLLTENTRTNGTTNKQVQNIMLPASLDWCRHKRRIRSLKVLCSCVFIMQNALSAIATFPVHLLGEGGGEGRCGRSEFYACNGNRSQARMSQRFPPHEKLSRWILCQRPPSLTPSGHLGRVAATKGVTKVSSTWKNILHEKLPPTCEGPP